MPNATSMSCAGAAYEPFGASVPYQVFQTSHPIPNGFAWVGDSRPGVLDNTTAAFAPRLHVTSNVAESNPRRRKVRVAMSVPFVEQIDGVDTKTEIEFASFEVSLAAKADEDHREYIYWCLVSLLAQTQVKNAIISDSMPT